MKTLYVFVEMFTDNFRKLEDILTIKDRTGKREIMDYRGRPVPPPGVHDGPRGCPADREFTSSYAMTR